MIVTGIKLEGVRLEDLGRAKRVVIEGRIKQILTQIEKTTSDYSGRWCRDHQTRLADVSYGFNATTGAFEDLIAANVVDLANLTRSAL